jgi:hypothetical protein
MITFAISLGASTFDAEFAEFAIQKMIATKERQNRGTTLRHLGTETF